MYTMYLFQELSEALKIHCLMIERLTKQRHEMARSTKAEYGDMYFVYCSSLGNATAASREHQSRYPDQKQLNRYVSATLPHSLKETGAFIPGRRNVQNEEVLL
jgi:hypothetical protein